MVRLLVSYHAERWEVRRAECSERHWHASFCESAKGDNAEEAAAEEREAPVPPRISWLLEKAETRPAGSKQWLCL